MEKQNHIWVVERLEGSAWMPTDESDLVKCCADVVCRGKRRTNKGLRFRVTKYTAPRGYA